MTEVLVPQVLLTSKEQISQVRHRLLSLSRYLYNPQSTVNGFCSKLNCLALNLSFKNLFYYIILIIGQIRNLHIEIEKLDYLRIIDSPDRQKRGKLTQPR